MLRPPRLATETAPSPTASRTPTGHFHPTPGPSGGCWIKRDSAYRVGGFVVEYRWHPLSGKKVRLFRRTVHGGVPVIHVDSADDKISRELPSWMVDPSVCRTMEVGSPQVSLSALRDLVKAIKPSSLGEFTRPVCSLEKENEP